MRLKTEPNLSEPDRFYEALIDVHRELSAEQSECLKVLSEALIIAEEIE
jgi:hypothetical protein